MITTIHIDIEGGWGGSSRSLYEMLALLDRNCIRPIVVHGKRGPISERYKAIGIQTFYCPEIASFVPRGKAIAEILIRLRALLQSSIAATRIAEIADQHGASLIHLNYEGLAFLGWLLKRRSPRPIVIHCRASRLDTGLFGKAWARLMTRAADHLFFIGPNEEQWFRACVPNCSVPSNIVWNIAGRPFERREIDTPPRLVYLGNIDFSKGVHRLVEVASALKQRGAPPFEVHIFGQARNSLDYFNQLKQTIANLGLTDCVLLRGYTSAPSYELSSALALIRPSLWNDPWGRDVIEATVAGCPVIATGTFNGVVVDGQTGFLISPYNATAMADCIVTLLQDSARWSLMSTAAALRGERFSGREQISTITATFKALAARSN